MIYYNAKEDLLAYCIDGVLLQITEGTVFRVLTKEWELVCE